MLMGGLWKQQLFHPYYMAVSVELALHRLDIADQLGDETVAVIVGHRWGSKKKWELNLWLGGE